MCRTRGLERMGMFCCVLIGAGCVRGTADLPQPGEGVFVTGIVVERVLSSGTVSGVEGAIVRASGTATFVATDARGFFQLDRLPVGRVKLFIERRGTGSKPSLSRTLGPFNALVDGQSIDLGEIELEEGGVLSGGVGLAQALPIALPASGAFVVLVETALSAIAGRDRDGRDGRYQLTEVPAGTYDAVAFFAGHEPGRALGVEIRPNVRSEIEDIVLSPLLGEEVSKRVRGQARLEGESDASGVRVTFRDESDPSRLGEAVTDEDGTFEITVSLGVYRVVFVKEGFRKVELQNVAVIREGVLGLVTAILARDVAGDVDGDGLPDSADPDRDNDGCLDDEDAFDDDPFGCLDTDGDGAPNERDADDDGDTLSDAEESSLGRDGFRTEPLDADTDDDLVPDASDLCPTVSDPSQRDRDSDGRGDACDDEASLAGPVIDRIEPTEGASGTLLMIFGMNFSSDPATFSAVRFGEQGPIVNVPPHRVSPSLILVEVPPDALTGPVLVFSGGGVAVSSEVFTFRPPPELLDFSPRSSRVGSHVLVEGRNLAAPGLRIFLGQDPVQLVVDASGTPILEDVFRAGEYSQRVRFVVPTGAASGVIRIETSDGSATSAVPFMVLAGPSIDRISPNPSGEGQSILILGRGFSTADTPGAQVTVSFAGVSSPITPLERSDTAMRMQVPAGAMNGPVTVHHPAGDAVSVFPLIIDPAIPVLLGMSPTLVKAGAGERVTLIGRNLTGATGVRFSGVPGVNLSVSDGAITAEVPAGAQPGEVTVEIASNAGTISSPRALRILSRRDNAGVGGWVAGAGFSGAGDVLYVVRPGTGETYDPDTLALLPPQIPLTFLPVGASIYSFQVAPDGSTGIITLTQPAVETDVVDLPSFALRGRCTDGVSAGGATREKRPYRFDVLSGFAYATKPNSVGAGEDAVFRIDLSSGTCDIVGRAPVNGGGRIEAVLPGAAGELLVAHSTLGLGIMNVNPSSSFDGALITPFIGTPIDRDQIFWGPGDFYIFGRDAAVSNPIARYVPFSADPAFLIDAGSPGLSLQSSDRRWMLSGDAFIDLESSERVRTGEAMTLGFSAAAHPTRNVFIVTTVNQTPVRLEILE